jgi:glyceraldehyde 3-phosphate dehydrogenase
MVKIGLNGFGRIGKCIFIQLMDKLGMEITAVNAPGLSVNEIEDYINYDSVHKVNHISLDIIDEQTVQLVNSKITILNNRDASKLEWKKYGCEYVIDATGKYLTTTKCQEHGVPYVIMSAPPKDDTPIYIYGVNSSRYTGENIVSASSCTSNALAPILNLLQNNYGINKCSFSTIHATTGSQNTTDIISKSKNRTHRSILGNIIPHSTGASTSVIEVIPQLRGKLYGNSLRVPVLNCSLLDINVELTDKTITLNDVINKVKSHHLYKDVFDINSKNLVSCDFLTTTQSCILDIASSIDMGDGSIKLMIWYDNEWSYSAQLIKLLQTMVSYHTTIREKYHINNLQMNNERVVLRLDFNVPFNNGEITDTNRIAQAIPTITSIMKQGPKYLIIASHLGRPKGVDKSKSLEKIIEVLELYLNINVTFLPHGLSMKTLDDLNSGIYLLENLRFHDEETNYSNIENKDGNEVVDIYRQLGSIYISDAFGCVHREHLSMVDMKNMNKKYGYGHLIHKEINMLHKLLNTQKKVLGIIGGNKIADKSPLIDALSSVNNTNLFVGGGLAKRYVNAYDNVYVMYDGYGGINLNESPRYIRINNLDDNFYDIGPHSYSHLCNMIDEADIIFWNGSMGIIEDSRYAKGSIDLMKYLCSIKDKTIIIGGGETASLFKEEKYGNNIFISTGGGALLEYIYSSLIENKPLPGLELFCE